MVDEAKLHNRICSTLEEVVQHVVGNRGEELGPLCFSVPAAGGAVFVHLLGLVSILLRCNGLARIQKAVVDQTSRRPANSDHDRFFGRGASFVLGSVLELFLSPTTDWL